MKKHGMNLQDVAIGFGFTGTLATLLSLIAGWSWGSGVFSPAAHGATGLTFFVVFVISAARKYIDVSSTKAAN